LSAEEIYARLLQRKSGGGAALKQEPQQTNADGGMANGPQETPGPGMPDPKASLRQSQVGTTTDGVPNPASMRSGGFGEVWDATDDQGHPASAAEKRRQEHEWSIAAEQALRSATACGHEPAGVEGPTGLARDPARFRGRHTPSDSRWTPPQSPLHRFRLYLPSVERRVLGEIVIAVDTSGSTLTDLCCDSYPEAPQYPALWVTDSRRAAPFGETVRISVE